MFTKAIKPGGTSVDLFQIDLTSEDEKLAASEKAKKAKGENTTDRTEEVPWRVFFGHEWEGHSFRQLVILTPATCRAQFEAKRQR